MSDENKEKNLPQTPDDGKEKTDGDWKWDAAVPETATDDITFDELAPVAESKPEPEKEEEPTSAEKEKEEVPEPVKEEKVEEKAEKKAEKKTEKKKEKKEEKAEKADKNDGVCVICGKSTRNSPNELYCVDCARKYLRTHFGIPQIILAFVMVFLAAFGYFICVTSVDTSAKLVKIENYVEQRRHIDAIEGIEDLSEELSTLDQGMNAVLESFNKNHKTTDIFVDGERSMRLLVNAYVDSLAFNEDQMNTYIGIVRTEIGEKKLKTRKYQKINDMYEYCLEVMSYSKEIGEDWYAFMYTDEETAEQKIKYDEAIAYLNSCPNKTPAQKSINGWYRYIAATFAEKGDEVIFAIFDDLVKDLGDYGYLFDFTYLNLAWAGEDYDRVEVIAERLYERNINSTDAYYYAIRANIIQGDFQKADERCEKMIADNPDSLDYYTAKAELLRRQSKYQESVDLCKTGITKGMDAGIYNQQSISYMLLENKEAALEAATSAYEIIVMNTQSSASYEYLNTIALIAYLCGDTDLYNAIGEYFKNDAGEVEFDEKVEKCIEGEITFEEIYMEGYGDI